MCPVPICQTGCGSCTFPTIRQRPRAPVGDSLLGDAVLSLAALTKLLGERKPKTDKARETVTHRMAPHSVSRDGWRVDRRSRRREGLSSASDSSLSMITFHKDNQEIDHTDIPWLGRCVYPERFLVSRLVPDYQSPRRDCIDNRLGNINENYLVSGPRQKTPEHATHRARSEDGCFHK
jgi:hypothetical protein